MFLVAAFILSPLGLQLLPGNSQKGEAFIKTMVLLEGKCEFRVDDRRLDCDDKMSYATFANHRVQINALPTVLGAAAFSGGKDMQFDPEHYYLTVDRLILSGGTPVKADGFCSIDLAKDGRRVYSVECKALARDGRRFEFSFRPTAEPPRIERF